MKRTFIYTDSDVFESPLKLYQLEKVLECSDFVRISKDALVNLMKIEQVTPQLNRNLLLVLKNHEKISLSRRYVKAFKDKLRGKSPSQKGEMI